MTCNHIQDSVNVAGGLCVVDEGAGVDVWILIGEGQLLSSGGGFARVPKVLEVNLGAGRDDVGEFDLAFEEGSGGPGLGDGDAWLSICQRVPLYCILATRHAHDSEVEMGSQGSG